MGASFVIDDPGEDVDALAVGSANLGDVIVERIVQESQYNGSTMAYYEDNEGYTHIDRTDWLSQARFEHAATVPDQWGTPHDVVGVRSTMLDPPVLDDATSIVSRQVEGESCHPWSVDATSYVDVHTRDLVRHDSHFVDPCGEVEGADPGRVKAYSLGWMGPNYGDLPFWPMTDAPWLVTVLQGRTLTAGQELTDVAAVREQAFIDRWSPQGPVKVESWMRAVGAQVHEGREGFVVRAGLNVSYSSFDGGVRFVDRYDETFLLDPHAPWTSWRATEHSFAGNEHGLAYSGWERRTATLVRYEPGTTPIGWGLEPLGAWGPRPETERTIGTHPVAGRGWSHPHRLETAIQGVNTDPTLIGFAGWKERNPGAILVGYTFAPTVSTPTGSSWSESAGATTWTLTYAAPNGPSAYRVASTRYSNGLTSNTEGSWSEKQLAPDDRLPKSGFAARPLITIGLAEHLWPRIMNNADEHEANYITWGYGTYEDPFYVLDGYGAFRPQINLHRLAIAHVTTTVAENDVVRVAPAMSGMLVLNITTGLPVRTIFGQWGDPVERALTKGEPHEPLAVPAPAHPDRNLSLISGGALATIGVAALVYALIKVLAPTVLSLLPGYAKVPRSAVLNHPLRDQLMQLIRDEPGISPPELHARVGGGWSTVIYHLGVLERNKLASAMIDGRHKRYFPQGNLDVRQRGAIAALRHDTTKRFLELISANPGVHQAVLRSETGLSQGATQWHIDRLIRAGLVLAERRGRRVHYKPVTLDAAHVLGVAA